MCDRSCRSPVQHPMRRCSSTRRTPTFRGESLIGHPECRSSQRSHRPHVRQGVRPRRRAHRRADRRVRGARAAPAHRPTVQPQHLRRRRARSGLDDSPTTSGISIRCGRRRLLYSALNRLNVRYWPSDANFVLAAFGRMPGGSIGPGRAPDTRPRQVARPGVLRLPPHHHRRRRAHTGVHCRARGGPVRRGVIDRQDDGDVDRDAAGPRRAGPIRRRDRYPFSRSHARAVRAPRRRSISRSRPAATSTSISITRSRISASRSARRSRRRSGLERGINRAGYFVMPMDETLGVAAIDLGGRAHAVVDLRLKVTRVGDLQSGAADRFLRGLRPGRARQRAPEGAVRTLEPPPGRGDVQGVRAGAARRVLAGPAAARMLPSTKGLSGVKTLR